MTDLVVNLVLYDVCSILSYIKCQLYLILYVCHVLRNNLQVYDSNHAMLQLNNCKVVILVVMKTSNFVIKLFIIESSQ